MKTCCTVRAKHRLRRRTKDRSRALLKNVDYWSLCIQNSYEYWCDEVRRSEEISASLARVEGNTIFHDVVELSF